MSALYQKAQLSNIFVSTVCPACKGLKSSCHMLCIPCTETVSGLKEFDECRRACDAHVEAISRLVERARIERRYQE